MIINNNNNNNGIIIINVYNTAYGDLLRSKEISIWIPTCKEISLALHVPRIRHCFRAAERGAYELSSPENHTQNGLREVLQR